MKKFLKYSVLTVCAVIFCIAAVFTVKGYAMYRRALNDNPPELAVEKIQSNENYVSIDVLPKLYLDSVLAVEDRRFYYHPGVDPISIARAVFNDIRRMKLVEGGSTITQQFAKNTFFTQERKLERKVAEALMALRLERMYSKKEILELYVNTIYFGSGYYSIREASRGYYDKEPWELSDYECTMLAGLPNAPSVYSLDNNPELAAQRQQQVVNKLVKYGYIKKKEGERILSGAH